jgi:hypothetical protein
VASEKRHFIFGGSAMPNRDIGRYVRFFLCWVALLTSGCVKVLGDFESLSGPKLDASVDTARSDGGVLDVRDATLEVEVGTACSAGEKACVGQELRVCNAGGTWQLEAMCPYRCTSGACTGVCNPGEQRCQAGMSSTCSSLGTWETPVRCDKLCAEDGCKGDCAPGATRCRETNLQTCNAQGTW